jgi:hypothetical protein
MTQPTEPATPDADALSTAEGISQADTPEDVQTVDTPEESQDDKPGNPEAAKYRRRLRDTEAERDTLRTQVQTLQRSIAEDIAESAGVTGKALWASGAELADLLGEDGAVAPEKVTEAAENAITELGLAPSPRQPQPNRQQGTSTGAERATTWGGAFKAATDRAS